LFSYSAERQTDGRTDETYCYNLAPFQYVGMDGYNVVNSQWHIYGEGVLA